MKETNLNLRAGQTGKITFTEVTGYTQEPSLRGGVKVNGTCVNMQLQPDGRTLVIPPLPEGVWIYEVRADGATALWGRLRVMESPLASASGCVCWQGSLDKDSQEVLYATLAISSGQQGEQGPKGDKGDPGPAPTAEQMQAAAAEMLYVPATTPHRTIVGTSDAELHWLQLDARRVPAGRLQAISIPCRNTAITSAPQGAPLYLTLWELTEDGSDYTMLGSSTEAVLQVVGQTARWEFEGIELSGRTFRICAALEPGGWAQNQWLGVRMAARETGEDTRGVGWGNIYQVTDITFEMEGVAPRFAAREDLEEIHGKFAVVDSRFEDVNGKFCDVEDKLHAADVKFDEVNTKFTNVDTSVSELFYTWYDTISPHIASRTVHITAEERARWDGNAMSPAEKAYMAQLLNNTEPPTSTGKLITEDVLLWHAEYTDMHVTAEERTRWNAAAADVAEHAQDTVVHVTAEERTRWDAAAPATHVGDATHLQNGGQKLVVKGMDGAVKLTIQGLLTNTQISGNALYVNVPDFSQRVTSTCIYSNSETATYIPWFAAAIDATALQPFGISEPGVHVGHAGYPLRLRGSEVTVNGTPLVAGGALVSAADRARWDAKAENYVPTCGAKWSVRIGSDSDYSVVDDPIGAGVEVAADVVSEFEAMCLGDTFRNYGRPQVICVAYSGAGSVDEFYVKLPLTATAGDVIWLWGSFIDVPWQGHEGLPVRYEGLLKVTIV